MYAVSYYADGRIQGATFRCPDLSRKHFEEKRDLNYPCALLRKDEEGESATAIAKHRYEELLRLFDEQVSNGAIVQS